MQRCKIKYIVHIYKTLETIKKKFFLNKNKFSFKLIKEKYTYNDQRGPLFKKGILTKRF